MTKAERQVKAVISRITRESITAHEEAILHQLHPGSRAKWCTASERRFLRGLHLLQELSGPQRSWLWKIALRYRERLAADLAAAAWRVAAVQRKMATASNTPRSDIEQFLKDNPGDLHRLLTAMTQ